MSKIYLFGPIALMKDHNREAFAEAALTLQGMGHEVFNPLTSTPSTPDIRQAMKWDLAFIISEAELLVGLPGWRASGGSLVEVHLAWRLNIPVYEYEFFSRRILRTVKNEFIWAGNKPDA